MAMFEVVIFTVNEYIAFDKFQVRTESLFQYIYVKYSEELCTHDPHAIYASLKVGLV